MSAAMSPRNPGVETRFFWLAILPFGVLVGTELMLKAWSSKVGSAATNMGVECTLSEATARLYVLSTVFMVLGVSIAAVLFLFGQIVSSSFAVKDKRTIALAFAVYCVIGFVAVFHSDLGLAGAKSASALDIYGKPWIEAVSAKLPGEPAALSLLRTTMAVVNVALLISASAAVTGSICCLFYGDNAHRPHKWRQQVSCAQSWLYIASGLLVCGLLYHRAWGAWLGSCLQGSVATTYGTLVSAFTANRAVQYSAFLAAFYVPVLAILNHQARSIASTSGRTQPSPGDEGLKIPFAEMAKTFCGIVAPLVVGLMGPIGDAFKLFGR
jgi:hypothetical protein